MSKICVITGATRAGIGEAVTRRLLKDGWSVFGSYDKGGEPSISGVDGGNLTLVEVDSSARDGWSPLLQLINGKKIDGFVNVEMYFNMETPENFDFDDFERSIFINLIAPNYLIHKLKRDFREGASAVIVTSTEGGIGSFGASGYAAAKAAVHNLVKTHANNLGSRNVRVNAIAPGWIGGVMDTDEVFNMSRKITPLGRLGEPKEVANVAAFLLSEEASFINGTVITVDGGYSGVDTISKFEFESQ